MAHNYFVNCLEADSRQQARTGTEASAVDCLEPGRVQAVRVGQQAPTEEKNNEHFVDCPETGEKIGIGKQAPTEEKEVIREVLNTNEMSYF